MDADNEICCTHPQEELVWRNQVFTCGVCGEELKVSDLQPQESSAVQ